jgi:hypothetical protein
MVMVTQIKGIQVALLDMEITVVINLVMWMALVAVELPLLAVMVWLTELVALVALVCPVRFLDLVFFTVVVVVVVGIAVNRVAWVVPVVVVLDRLVLRLEPQEPPILVVVVELAVLVEQVVVVVRALLLSAISQPLTLPMELVEQSRIRVVTPFTRSPQAGPLPSQLL